MSAPRKHNLHLKPLGIRHGAFFSFHPPTHKGGITMKHDEIVFAITIKDIQTIT